MTRILPTRKPKRFCAGQARKERAASVPNTRVVAPLRGWVGERVPRALVRFMQQRNGRIAMALLLVVSLAAVGFAVSRDDGSEQRVAAGNREQGRVGVDEAPTAEETVVADDTAAADSGNTTTTATRARSASVGPTASSETSTTTTTAATTTTTTSSTTTTGPKVQRRPTDDLLVILSDFSIVRVDAATGEVGPAIRTAAWPSSIVVSPDGSTTYVGDHEGILPIKLANDEPQPRIRPGFAGVGSMAMTPDGRYLYAAGGEGQLTRIDLTTGQVGQPISYGGRLAMAPDGSKLYVTRGMEGGSEGGHLVPIDVATNEPGTPVFIQRWLGQPVVSADGRTVFIQTRGPACGAGDVVVTVVMPEGIVGPEIRVRNGTDGLFAGPDRRTLYVSPRCEQTAVTLIDAVQGTVTREIDLPDTPPGAWSFSFDAHATSPDEQFLYLGYTRTEGNGGPSGDGALFVLDLETGGAVQTVKLKDIRRIAVVPAR